MNTYNYELSVNSERAKRKKEDENVASLICGIIEYAAKDLRRAIRRDIIMRQYNSRFTNKHIERIAKLVNRDVDIQKLVNEYDKKYGDKELDYDIVTEDMRTKTIVQFFAIMGKNNYCEYIIERLIDDETEKLDIKDDYGNNFVEMYKKKFLEIYEKEVERYG